MPRHIAQVDKRQSRVIALPAGASADLDRWSASLSLLVITFLSVAGWAVIGGLAYWTLH
jgi:hypothetical protein